MCIVKFRAVRSLFFPEVLKYLHNNEEIFCSIYGFMAYPLKLTNEIGGILLIIELI